MQIFTVGALAFCVCHVFHVELTSIASARMINQSILKILLIIDCKSVITIMPKDILFMHTTAK